MKGDIHKIRNVKDELYKASHKSSPNTLINLHETGSDFKNTENISIILNHIYKATHFLSTQGRPD